jgi:hypothetical protein
MTTITLPPEVEEPLAEEAQRQGTTPELLAIGCLRKLFVPGLTEVQPSEGETLSDFLAGYVGTVNGATDPLSEDCGRRFVQGLVEKQPPGRL